MKCIISRRCLLTVALAVSAPLPSSWLMEATAQDSDATPGPIREGDRPVFSNSGVLGDPFEKSSSKPVFFGSGVLGDPNNQASVRYAGARSQADYREVRTRKLLSDYSRTDDEKGRAKVLEDLTKVVSEQFEVRQESRERELKEVEEHVRKLRELHQRRGRRKTRSSAIACASFSVTSMVSAGATTDACDQVYRCPAPLLRRRGMMIKNLETDRYK